MFHTSRKTRCANNLPLENKSFRWTKLQKRAAKKTSNCSKKDTNYLKIWKIAWHFFHPRNHHIYAGFSITYHWQKNCIPVADKDPEVPEVIWCVFGGFHPFLSAKPLSPNQLVDSTKVFNWRGVFDSKGYGQLPPGGHGWASFFSTLFSGASEETPRKGRNGGVKHGYIFGCLFIQSLSSTQTESKPKHLNKPHVFAGFSLDCLFWLTIFLTPCHGISARGSGNSLEALLSPKVRYGNSAQVRHPWFPIIGDAGMPHIFGVFEFWGMPISSQNFFAGKMIHRFGYQVISRMFPAAKAHRWSIWIVVGCGWFLHETSENISRIFLPINVVRKLDDNPMAPVTFFVGFEVVWCPCVFISQMCPPTR